MTGAEEDDLAAAWGEALEQEGGRGSRPGARCGARAEPGRDRQPARLRRRRRRSGETDRHRAHRQRRPGLLRTPADAGDRLRPAGAHHVDLACAISPRDNVEVSIDSIVSLRFGDYLNSVPLPAMLAVFKVEEWDNYGLLVVDSALIYSVVDVLLGGRRGTAAMRIEGRPYTTIERTLVERLITVVLQDLSDAFEPAVPGAFPLRAAGGEPALRRRLPPVQRLHPVPPAGRHGGPRRQDRAAAALCDAGAGARAAAAAVHGREIRPRQHLGNPSGGGAAAYRARARRGAGRAGDAAAADHVAAARRPHHAERRARRAGDAPLRRGPAVRGRARPAGEPPGGADRPGAAPAAQEA